MTAAVHHGALSSYVWWGGIVAVVAGLVSYAIVLRDLSATDVDTGRLMLETVPFGLLLLAIGAGYGALQGAVGWWGMRLAARSGAALAPRALRAAIAVLPLAVALVLLPGSAFGSSTLVGDILTLVVSVLGACVATLIHERRADMAIAAGCERQRHGA